MHAWVVPYCLCVCVRLRVGEGEYSDVLRTYGRVSVYDGCLAPWGPDHNLGDVASMFRSTIALVALFVLPSAALQVSPLSSRRQAVASAARLVPGLVLLPQIAHADAIADIAARNNAAAAETKVAKAKAKEEGPGFLDQAGSSIASVVAPAAGLSLIGGIAFFGSQLVGQSGIVDDVADNMKEKRRVLTPAEKRKYAALSDKEKRDLGIKGL